MHKAPKQITEGGSCSCLRRSVGEFGFRRKGWAYRKGVSLKGTVHDLCAHRTSQHKTDRRSVIFQDVTYIHGSHTRGKNRVDDDSGLVPI
jgi:hypothetical protein